MLRLVFVNRFYAPDQTATAQLLTDLAEHLAACGHQVTVITSRRTGIPAAETLNGVLILRTQSRFLHANRAWLKGFAFAHFHIAAAVRMLRYVRRGDVIVALTDPPLIGATAALVARCRGARLVHWVHDIYPEIAVAVTGIRALMACAPLRNASWRVAVRCVTLSDGMRQVIVRHGATNAIVVPNWPPRGLYAIAPGDNATEALRREWGIAGRFVVLYSGNLGRVHDLHPALAAAQELAGDPSIVFVFVGAGAQLEALERAARQLQLPNVLFRPPQPRVGLSQSLGVGDIHLVSLRPACDSYVFPSKLYGAAAAGRPVLFIGAIESEVAQTIARSRFGMAVPANDAPALAQAIRRLAAAPALRFQMSEAALVFGRSHDSAVCLSRWREILERSGYDESAMGSES